MPNETTIEIIRGRTFTRTLTFRQTSLTGATVQFTLGRRYGDPSPLVLLSSPSSGIAITTVASGEEETYDTLNLDGSPAGSVTTEAGDSIATITIAKTATDDLPVGRYVFDAVVTWSDGTESEIMRGTAMVYGSSTP